MGLGSQNELAPLPNFFLLHAWRCVGDLRRDDPLMVICSGHGNGGEAVERIVQSQRRRQVQTPIDQEALDIALNVAAVLVQNRWWVRAPQELRHGPPPN